LHLAVPTGDNVASKIATSFTTDEHTHNFEIAIRFATDHHPFYPQDTTGIATVEHTGNPEVAPSFTTGEHTDDPRTLASTTAGESDSSNNSSGVHCGFAYIEQPRFEAGFAPTKATRNNSNSATDDF